MASLMDLPVEVRLLIFSAVLHSTADKISPNFEDNDGWMEANDIYYKSFTRSASLEYQKDPRCFQSRASSLLRINHQCHTEIKGLIKGLCYIYEDDDLTIEEHSGQDRTDGCDTKKSAPAWGSPPTRISNVKYHMELYATTLGAWRVAWTDIPFKAAWVRELHVTLKNTVQQHGELERPGITKSAPSPYSERQAGEFPHMGCILWSLLERFMVAGIQPPRPKYSNIVGESEDVWYSGVNVDFQIGCVIFHIDDQRVLRVSAPTRDKASEDADISFVDRVRQMAERPLNASPRVRSPPDATAQLDRLGTELNLAINRLKSDSRRPEFRTCLPNIGQFTYYRGGRLVQTLHIGNPCDIMFQLQQLYDPLSQHDEDEAENIKARLGGRKVARKPMK